MWIHFSSFDYQVTDEKRLVDTEHRTNILRMEDVVEILDVTNDAAFLDEYQFYKNVQIQVLTSTTPRVASSRIELEHFVDGDEDKYIITRDVKGMSRKLMIITNQEVAELLFPTAFIPENGMKVMFFMSVLVHYNG